MRKNKSVINSTRLGYDKKGNMKSTTFTTTTTDSSSSYGLNMRRGLKSALAVIFVVMLVLLVIRMALTKDIITFTGLLEFLQNFNNDNSLNDLFNNISNGLKSFYLSTLPSVNIFGVQFGFAWISDIWNLFVDIESVIFWLGGNLLYVVKFIIALFRFAFVV